MGCRDRYRITVDVEETDTGTVAHIKDMLEKIRDARAFLASSVGISGAVKEAVESYIDNSLGEVYNLMSILFEEYQGRILDIRVEAIGEKGCG